MRTPAFGYDETPVGILRRFFRYNYPRIFDKVARQVRRSPRRQTGQFKTNRQNRWNLDPGHPDYTAETQIPLIEAKLLALTLCFEGAPAVQAEVKEAAGRILGYQAQSGTYQCPISGRPMSFAAIEAEARTPVHGRSSFHVGHVRPKAMGGENVADNTYWTSDLGNRIQGDKSWADTVKTIIEIAEYQRRVKHGNISWGELVNRYLH
jgi:hypothetical protein